MPREIKLTARPAGGAVNPDATEAGAGQPRPGDRTVFSHDLFMDGRKTGFDGGTGTVVRTGNGGTFRLVAMSLHLRDGTITLQGLVEDTVPATPFYAAVTGGTGLYSEARGEMYVYPASAQEQSYRLYLHSPG
jgi:allene oxide cyclase-like protein